MAIADIADSRPTQPKKGPSCATCLELQRLPEEEATALRALLADHRWRYTELADELREKAGIDIASQNLARHARGACAARERLR